MNTTNCLRAGAGRAVIDVAGVLPVEGFTAVQSEMHARVLLLESNIRIAIVSLEITQIPDSIRQRVQEGVCRICRTSPEHVWITTTHSFAGPHLFEEPKPGEKPRPGQKIRSSEEIEKGNRLCDNYLAAVESACTQAINRLRNAAVGCAAGVSDVAVNRNIETNEGWWTGTNSALPCDKTFSLLRIDAEDGEPLAALFVFGLRSSVMNKVRGADGGSLVSSDLCGGTCTYLEEKFGGDFVAVFLCGAACDQDPLLKGVSNELDKDNKLVETNAGAEKAAVLLEAQSSRLGCDILQTWRSICLTSDAPVIRMGTVSGVCETKDSTPTPEIKPARNLTFAASGETVQTVSGLVIGPFLLAGFQPEMGGVTSAQIRSAFPQKTAAMAIMVNGAGKCMPDESAYSAVMYQSQNTPFMPGSAEKLRDAAITLLNELQH